MNESILSKNALKLVEDVQMFAISEVAAIKHLKGEQTNF